jgi:hypothetical protein
MNCYGTSFVTSFSPRLLVLASLVCAGLLAGCNGSSGTTSQLSGKVTLDGDPLPAQSIASITFRPDPTSKAGPISVEIVDSKYFCPSVPRGKVTAEMSISVPTGRSSFNDRVQREVAELENVVLVPEQRKGIEIEVSGNDARDFDLKRSKK